MAKKRFEETKNEIRERLMNPALCKKGSFRSKKVKEGVRIIICQTNACVNNLGESKCPTKAQSLVRSKQFYELKNDKIFKKDKSR